MRAATLNSFGWSGRDPRLALADTLVKVREDEYVDLLDDPSQLVKWLAAEQGWLGVVAPEDAPALVDVNCLRSAIRTLLFATTAAEPLPNHAASVVNRFSAASPRYRQIDLAVPEQPRATVSQAGDTRALQVLAAIADAAIDLLTCPDRARVRICSAPSCGMFFLAVKPGQRWCSGSCGNRARVARHYERTIGMRA